MRVRYNAVGERRSPTRDAPAARPRSVLGDFVQSLGTILRGTLRLAVVFCAVAGWSISALARQHENTGRGADQLRQGAERRFRNGLREHGDWNGRQRPFGPSDKDRGPLEPGEAERLADFAEQHFPRMHDLLERIRSEDPDKFRRQIQRFAPKLRFLIRLKEENPPLALILIERANNDHRLRQYLRRWRDAGKEARRRIKHEVRVRIEKNLRLEEKTMALRMEKLSESRDAMIEKRFARLTSEDAEIATEPAELRELVDVFRAAPEDQRVQIEAQIRAEIAAGIDDELGAIRQRIEQRERNRAEEVDRRTRRFFSRSYKSRPKSKRP